MCVGGGVIETKGRETDKGKERGFSSHEARPMAMNSRFGTDDVNEVEEKA